MSDSEQFTDLFKVEELKGIVDLTEEALKKHISYRNDNAQEVKTLCRELNGHGRLLYKTFSERVGRNVYPLIIASDHEPEFSGVGTTFTLFLEDGTMEKMTPALSSNYEVYKSVSHTLLTVTVLVGPFLANPTAEAWRKPFTEYVAKVDILLSAIRSSTDPRLEKDVLVQMLSDVSSFLHQCLDDQKIDEAKWREMNQANSLRAKDTMNFATKDQAEANVSALMKWKKRLGPVLWREVYVVIPTVWPVAGNNPRMEIFRNLLDEDRIDTNIFCSEQPRTVDECRTLVGRIVGDRAVGRFVFGLGSHETMMKTVALSTPVDVVLDDALPNIHAALRDNGCEVRPYMRGTKVQRWAPEKCPFNTVWKTI